MSDRAGLPATAPEALREVVGDDPTPELAAALAMNPAVVAVLLAEHVADPAGRCTACPGARWRGCPRRRGGSTAASPA